ncbi:Phenylacetic acid degradation-related domain-containing protein [Desulfonema limicola]|uniref:Phenylacetic acid degradation-related domain-containing protein n=1 Tax=Desulfonema limicola TaxID=45656 RepID=A0A975B769_9BACT|nr:PaaI family thioesterase [Desulfonema limicola]QTA80043.1 Phenylacetic acid degradation-related domain-containing protein [Desulfonema limicola]
MINKDQFLKKDKFALHLGIELLEVSEGFAKAKLDIKEKHLNGHNIVHGGAVFSLADLAFAAASNSYGNTALAINASISYVKAAPGGTLFAQARETSLNHKLGTYTVDITNENNDRIAIFQGMVYRKKQKYD